MTFSRESAESPPLGGVLALGVLAACTVLYLRVLVLCAALNPGVATAALRFVMPPLVVALAGLGILAATGAAALMVSP